MLYQVDLYKLLITTGFTKGEVVFTVIVIIWHLFPESFIEIPQVV